MVWIYPDLTVTSFPLVEICASLERKVYFLYLWPMIKFLLSLFFKKKIHYFRQHLKQNTKRLFIPGCASLNGVQKGPGPAGGRSLFPPLGWRLCFLHVCGEVGGDCSGETTGEVDS